MQSDEDFNVKFVNLVKMYKCLYDKKVPEYRNKDEQEKAWFDIAKETHESVSHCKERWRNLRACLSRYIKQQSSADPQHKPYYLAEHMQFLLPFLKSHRPSSINESYSGCDYNSDLNVDLKTLDPEDTNDQDFHNSHQDDYSINVTNRRKLSGTDTTLSVNCVQNPHVDMDNSEAEPEVLFSTSTERIHHDAKRLKLDNTHDTINSSLYAENSDMDFFRSVLPDIQGMTAVQRRKFKIGVLELIDEVLLKYPA
ncbi:uncharacterized protein LOC119650781 isoform X2 [Hermetia illucens]|nr:uncharacterized protein LOC119650781 isoform X2 [Hermetia illucens]